MAGPRKVLRRPKPGQAGFRPRPLGRVLPFREDGSKFLRPGRERTDIILRRRGPRRGERIGDPLEQRAVPKSTLPGSILERITYRAIWDRLGRPSPWTWDPQPAFQGGRLELGGLVADIIIRNFGGVSIIIQVQSFAFHPRPDHQPRVTARFADQFKRVADEEARQRLESMRDPLTSWPMVVLYLWEDVILNARRLEDWMDRHLNARFATAALISPPQVGSGGMPTNEYNELIAKISSLESELEDFRKGVLDIAREGAFSAILPAGVGTTWANLQADRMVVVHPTPTLGDFYLIQDAIDHANKLSPSASEPWLVLAMPALYVEAVTMAQFVSVSALTSAATIIDAQAAGYTITAASNCELNGFEIRNTVSTTSAYGGINIVSESDFFAFDNFINIDGTGSGDVAGIRIEGSNGTGESIPRFWNTFASVTVPSGATGRCVYATGSTANAFVQMHGGQMRLAGAGDGASVECDTSTSSGEINILDMFVSCSGGGNKDCARTNAASLAIITARNVAFQNSQGTGEDLANDAGILRLRNCTWESSRGDIDIIEGLRHSSDSAWQTMFEGFGRAAGELDVRGLWIAPDLNPLLYQGLRTLTLNGNARARSDEAGAGRTVPYWDFDGTGDYLSHADHADFDITGDLTFGVWIWMDSLVAGDVLWGKWTSSGNERSYVIYCSDTSGSLNFAHSDTGSYVAASDLSASNDISAATWSFVVGRLDAGTSIDIDVNGTNTTGGTAQSSIHSGTSLLAVYAEGDGAAPADGRCAMAFVIAALMTDDEVDELYQRTRVLFGV